MRDYLKKNEAFAVLALAFLHIVLLPLTIELFRRRFGLTDAQFTFAEYAAASVLCLLLLGGFLRRSFDSLADSPWLCIRGLILGFFVYYLLSMLVTPIIAGLELGTSTPNDDRITAFAYSDRGLVLAVAFVLAPIVEECIFRGGLFCGLYPKGRALAYIVSVLAFGLYHVWQFVFLSGDPRYLLYIICYLPHSIALCAVYERSGSLWSCVFFHSALNIYSVNVLGL